MDCLFLAFEFFIQQMFKKKESDAGDLDFVDNSSGPRCVVVLPQIHIIHITESDLEKIEVKKLRKTSWILSASVLAILGSLGAIFTQPVSAIVPAIQNVTVFEVGGSTYLNVTVLHTPEIQGHYVDTIEVILGSNTTDLTIGVQELNPDDTFVITYDIGPVTAAPEATIRAHCIVNGWSVTNWTGTIPEFPIMTLTLLMFAATSLVMILLRKNKMIINKQSV